MSNDPVRVLLVDDEPMFLAAVRALLELDDRMVVVGAANNGGDALLVADSESPDVALVDLALPQMDGFETTRRLLEEHPAMKVIAVSGLSDGHAEDAARAAGAISFLLKGGLHAEIADAIFNASEQPFETRA
ncbi:MAG: two-component system, NarL family, response regulator LiaR [Gaiellaceae bacterium]|nr:two-component system, NarL family, response regulator LiaR [Gaiellaceae bacterium]